jgi:hypothetical protein
VVIAISKYATIEEKDSQLSSVLPSSRTSSRQTLVKREENETTAAKKQQQ